MNWLESLNVFATVAKLKSFAQTAKTHHMPTSKVTKLIQSLEYQLKTTLFIRTTRSVTLTENGNALLQQTQTLLEQWQQLKNQMLENIPQGVIKIAAPPSVLSSSPFMEWIKGFLEKFPKISLQTFSISQPIHLTDSTFDILIGKDNYLLDTSAVIGHAILSMQYGFYASPDYLKKMGYPKSPVDLKKHNCLVFLEDYWWPFKEGTYPVSGNFRANNGVNLFGAACAGLGIIRVPDFMVTKEREAGRLIALLEKSKMKPEVLKIYYPKLNYQPQKLKVLIQYLLEQAKRY